ncbi:MAG: NAD-dependent epimerase/dehydratase family protein [bacterium]|nr:NAD-dependent epimerase/dehydratase family protein [bacterium]
MKALVTGGTGFVGSHVVRALVDAGHQVRVLHRASSRLDALAGLEVESARGDITDLDALRAACAGIDWVFHVAAVADYWRADKARMYDANVEGTRRVLTAAREAGVRRVVFTSSAAAVGLRADGTPSDEGESFRLPPERFPYGHTKALAERVCAEAIAAGQDVVIVNPVVVLGPGDLNRISGDLLLKTRRFSWTIPVPPGGVALIDVRDAARMHIAAARQGRTGERYILGTANYAHADLFALIARVTGSPAPGIPLPGWAAPILGDLIELGRKAGIPLPLDGSQTRLGAEFVYFNFEKAWNELARPLVSIPQSVQDTWDWYTQHGYVTDDAGGRLIAQIGRALGV